MSTTLKHAVTVLTFSAILAATAEAQLVDRGRAQFNTRCSGCHGLDGTGGERAPAITKGSRQTAGTEAAIRNLIQQGLPEKGMPGFAVTREELDAITAFVRSRILPLADTDIAGDPRAGERIFFGDGRCAGCHMIHGRGSWNGPDLTEVSLRATLPEAEQSIREPSAKLVPGYGLARIELVDGNKVDGFIRAEGDFDAVVQTRDGDFKRISRSKVRTLTKQDASAMPKPNLSMADLQNLLAFLREAPKWQPNEHSPEPATTRGSVSSEHLLNITGTNWPTYNGRPDGNRYSPLTQISKANVAGLAPRWSFPAATGRDLETTPVVINGTMYVTAVNTVYALDAKTGQQIWKWSRPTTKGLVGDAASGINRGVAILGDRVFVVTDNAHLVALHRVTGGLIWETEMADSRQHYGATSAPLVVKDLVLSGVSGGDEGNRGFLSAYKASTGERVWRFWTIPSRSDPEASTWKGKDLEHGCGSTWFTGTFDISTDTLFWPVGNPCPDFDGEERQGDNLYTDSVLAFDPATGKLKWYYQFTPHDVHDWDATETPMLVDATYQGRSRKLLLHGNRNGFFYVLDRTTGKPLTATPFVRKLTWASKIGPDGRPVLTDTWKPTAEGTEICPSMDGASNWMSPAFHPGTGLFYLQALEKCNVYTRRPESWKQGESFYGGAVKPSPHETPRKYLRAIDINTGQIRWEREQTGNGNGWGGVLATAGGLVFSCDDSGEFIARDAKSGDALWHYNANVRWHASPMTYAIDGRQFIAVAAGSTVIAFAVAE